MGGKRFRTKAMRAHRVHISLLPLATLVAPILGQLQFNGGVSSSSSNSNSNSANRNTNRPTSGDVDEKFFLGGDTPSLTGNQALDGGIVGLVSVPWVPLFSVPPSKVPSTGPSRARASTPVEGGGGKHLERISLEQGSLAVSLVAPLTVAAAVTTASLSTTTVSTATSRTREDSTTRVSTARALTRTRASTTRTTESANATTA